MKELTINFKFTDEQYSEIENESQSMDMSPGEMLMEVMKFIVADMLKTRNE